MNVRNGIRIEQPRKKQKRKTAPNLRLNTVSMIHSTKGVLRLPNFAPVLELMKRSGWT